MNPISNHKPSSWYTSLIWFDFLHRGKKLLAFLILLMAGAGFSGCFDHYYQTNTVHKVDANTLESLIKAHKYFVLHTDAGAYALTNIKVSNEFLDGKLDSLARDHEDYLDPKRPERNKITDKDNTNLFYEVHIYPAAADINISTLHIPLKDISRMDVYSFDSKHTKRARVASIAGLTLATAGVVGLIVAAGQANHSQTTPAPNGGSSGDAGGYHCSPQVYVLDHQDSLQQGTLYSGAIYASLERTDYIPLSIPNPGSDQLRMMIRGERNEELMFNNVRLLEIKHATDCRPLLDRHGKVLLYGQPVLPFQASIGDREKDVMHEILARDSRYYSFTNDGHGDHASDIVLDFRKPKGISSGKLLIRAKNSPWAYYLFQQYKSLYGEYYNTLVRKKDSADVDKVLQCELDQYLPLLVAVKKNGEWKYLDYFPTPGNSGPRDLIMELDLSGQEDADHVEVRLQTTYFFWDLDYVAMDFSQNEEFVSRNVNASKISITGTGMNAKEVSFNSETHLSVSDKQMLNLEFQLGHRENANQEFSYFLVGRGYYHDDTRFPGKPNFAEIGKFSGKGAFDQYSREKLEVLVNAFKENEAQHLAKVK